MSNIKKLLVLIIVFALFMNAVVYAAPASDLKDDKYGESIQILNDLGIIKLDSGTAFEPDKVVTRAEFAKILSGLVGLHDEAESVQEDTSFSDVTQDNLASGAINMMVKLGIMSGYNDGRFDPDGTVTYQQAVKAFVCALGYQLYADQKGGYPAGYLMVGAEKGITKGVAGAAADLITQGQIVQLMYNVIDIDMMEQTQFGSDAQYTSEKDVTLLSKRLNIYKEDGRITATNITRLDGESSLNDNEVEIEISKNGQTETKIYKIGNSNAKDYLGYQVTYYYKQEKDSSDEVILHIQPNKNKNDVLKIQNDNIESYNQGKYTYWEDKEKNSAEKTAEIAAGADIIYNGKAITSITDCLNNHADKFGTDPANIFYPRDPQDKLILGGNVVLIDSSGSGKYNVVIITAYENYVVQSTSETNHTIYFKDGSNALVLDPDDHDIDFSIKDQKGEAVELANLDEWNILSVAKSINDSYINVILTTDKIDGTIAEVGSNDDNNRNVVIGEKEYDVAANFNMEDLKVDDTGTYYLDVEGKIAAVNKTSTRAQLGYLMDVDINNSGVNKRLEFKILTTDNNIVYFNGADKLSVDNTGMIEYSVVPAALLQNVSNTIGVKQQLLCYTLNADGNINKIDTANVSSDESIDNSLQLVYQSDSAKDTNGAGLIWKTSNKILGGRMALQNSTYVFSVPTDASFVAAADDSYYFVTNINSMKSDKWFKNVSAYKIGNNGMKVDAVIIPALGGVHAYTDGDTPVTIVDKVVTTVDENGNTVKKLYGYTNGVLTDVVEAENDTTLDKYQTGDIIRYEKNRYGKIGPSINNVSPYIYDILINNNVSSIPSGNWDGTDRFDYGYIYEKSGNIISVTTKNDPSKVNPQNGDCMLYSIDNVVVYTFDQANKKIKKATESDMVDYVHGGSSCPHVFVYGYKGECRTMIIYK